MSNFMQKEMRVLFINKTIGQRNYFGSDI